MVGACVGVGGIVCVGASAGATVTVGAGADGVLKGKYQ